MPRRTSKAQRLSIAAAAGAALGGAAAGVAVQRRHVRTLGHDPGYTELNQPLDGRPIWAQSADGTRLHAKAFGREGAPTILLIHGWTEQLTLWGPVIRLLVEQDLRAVAYDLRGHGHSGPATGEDYSLARFGEDVEAVLGAVTAESDRAVVVGHSLGAMSIAAWAEHHEVADRVRAAVLINTGLVDLLTGNLLFGEVARRFNSQRVGKLLVGSRAPLPGFSSPLALSVIRHAAFGPDASTAQVAFYERMLLDCPSGVRAACGRAMADMDLQPALARLTIPTLVIDGDRDRLTPPAHARRIAEALPRPAGLIELERTGHMSPLERPAELARAIVDLAAQPAAGTLLGRDAALTE